MKKRFRFFVGAGEELITLGEVVARTFALVLMIAFATFVCTGAVAFAGSIAPEAVMPPLWLVALLVAVSLMLCFWWAAKVIKKV